MNQQKTLSDTKKIHLNLCETNNEYPLVKPMFIPRHLSGTCDSSTKNSCRCHQMKKDSLSSSSKVQSLQPMKNKETLTNDSPLEIIELFAENETKIYRKRRSTTKTHGDEGEEISDQVPLI